MSGNARGGSGGKGGSMPAEVKTNVLTAVLPAAVDLPPSPVIQPPPELDKQPDDPTVLAQDYLLSIYLALETSVANLNKLLLSEKGPRFRQVAAEHRLPIGGDGRQWPPLNAMLRVLLDMNPLAT